MAINTQSPRPRSASVPASTRFRAHAGAGVSSPDAAHQLQMPHWEFESLMCDYEDWRLNLWRGCRLRGNVTEWQKEKNVVRLIYCGWGGNKISEMVRSSKATVFNIGTRFRNFLQFRPKTQKPLCACGRPSWHANVCDSNFPARLAAARKGLATQARLRRERETDIFFQTLQQTHAMTTTITQPSIESNAARFASLVQQGIDAWTEAGRLLVEMLTENPDAKSAITNANPDLTDEILSRFEAIGRNQLHPKCLLNNSPGMRRLRGLPFSDQSRYLESPVPLLVQKESGIETLQVAVRNLTTKQAQQVFANGYVRAPDAQRAWLESKRPHKKKNGASYTVKNGKVLFHQDCELNAREIADIMAKLAS